MALLVQPTARVHLQAPSPPSFLPVALQLAAQVPAPLKPPLPPRLSLSHPPCQLPPLCPLLHWSMQLLLLLLTPSHQPSHQNTFHPRVRLQALPFRSAALCPVGSVYLQLRPLLLQTQVRILRLNESESVKMS